jgi:ribosomal-protein-alanine N-acetyltransferase
MTARGQNLPVLSDGVVRLRPFVETDAPALVEIWSDPAIRSRNTVPDPSAEAALEWIAGRATAPASGETWEWALVDAATNALAGRRALKGINWEQGRANAACWVGPAFRGRQFAARSLRLAAAHAFAQGLVRVQAECEADNEASLRSVRAAGMRHEGTLRSFFVSNAGVHVDAEVFGLLADDLANAPAFRSSWPGRLPNGPGSSVGEAPAPRLP